MTASRYRPEADARAIQTKLGAARTRLILERPFIGALVLHLPFVEADPGWCPTTATDARAFYYSGACIERLTLGEIQFALAHEAMHCALGHFARRAHRAPDRWDVACDHAVNLLLEEEGLTLPAGALAGPAYRGLSAEEIYPLIAPDTLERTYDRHVYHPENSGGSATRGPFARAESGVAGRDRAHADSARSSKAWEGVGNERTAGQAGVPRPRAPGTVEQERLMRQWQMRLVTAAQQARRAGWVGGTMLRRTDEIVRPRLPWRHLLARYMASMTRDDYSFQRPARREGSALLPRLASSEVHVAVALDTSGSIGREDMLEFVAEVNALKAQIRARVTLHACDDALDAAGPWHFHPWEPMRVPEELAGGGGTRFNPVFEWLAGQPQAPDLLVYFTDAEGEFPDRPPPYPVIWLVKGGGRVPWGERIQLN